ncbi:MAG: polysaccharide biosynthesis tyrosine autokinase [Bacteroidaceae bacterium]|nr:polysaccharide biosynthesis tyrosine autokinase [Bacteroidaceae bacterium]
MAEYIETPKAEENESSGIDYRKIWSIIVLHWYWFVFSTLFFVSLAYIYLRYQAPVYQASAKVLIKDEGGVRRSSGTDLAMDQLGVISNSNGFDNEMEIISSTAVATKAVKSLKLYVTYTMHGRVGQSDVYKTSPVIVDLEESRQDVLQESIPMTLVKHGEGIRVEITLPSKTNGEGEIMRRDITTFPATITTKVGKILFTQNPGFELPEREMDVVIYPPVMVGRAYARRLSAQPSSKMTTVAVLSMLDTSTDRACDYLSQLVQSYNEDANEDKNEVARKTEEFINERIEIIRSELDETEGDLEGYKRSNQLVNLPTDASQALTQTTDFQKRQVDIQTQISLVQGLLDYVHNPNNDKELIPANLGITDQSTNRMISDYNTKLLARNRLAASSSEEAPAVQQLTAEVAALWAAVEQQLRSIYRDLQVQKNSIDSQFAHFSSKVSSTPTQERVLNNIGRQQEIKANLYLMLLQKREENYISLASTANKARIIDMPQNMGKVSPKSTIIMLAAFLLGAFLPLMLFYLFEMLRFRINGREDIEKLTKLSVVADIPLTSELAEGERAIVVKENTNNMMEEAFRGLRTNLGFIMTPTEKVLCCTSCVPGEGKTFVATNLAMSLALLGKKVIIIGLDVRKPRLVKLFGLPKSEKGITAYLSQDKADFALLEDQIVRGVVNKNLDVLPAGLIPPNPGELITRSTLDEGLEYLKTKYDYIILDTPPVGLVSDTYALSRLVDVTFFIVRAEHTTKGDFELINRTDIEHKMPKINIVLNGVDLNKRTNGFYYGYGKYGTYSKYGTYYGRYGHYGTYGNYGDKSRHIEK